ncbi:MAG: hypothetical protein RIR10_1692 [Planctomycetota bacterium]|jgi:four helix bundle protein
MARLQAPFIERIESFCDRVVHVATALNDKCVSRRIIDQLMASGTSVGANAFEADEAMSRSDFSRCLAIALKELNETRFWLRLAARHGWIPEHRLNPLLIELQEIRSILGTMIARTKRKAA